MCKKLICLYSFVLVLALVGSASAQTGQILIEWWTDISGGALSGLLSHADYPGNPTGSGFLTSFEVPASGAKPPELADLVDNYGARVRGYFHPPSTGEYTFWIVSDDEGQLFLSPQGSSDSKVMIARVLRYSNVDQWTKYLGQRSAPIRLEAGKKYYIEAVYKEAGGGDHLQVAYGDPGAQVVIPGSQLSPFDPGMASDPSPTGGSSIDMNWATLTWTAPATAASHDVYFGDSYADVLAGTADTYKGRQPDASYYAVGLVAGTTYYWRIDEVEADGTTIHTGEVWSFAVNPSAATNPSPADGATWVATDVQLSWTPGFGAFMYYVYFGTNQTEVADGTGGTAKGIAIDPSFTPGPLTAGTTYYWRIDAFTGATHTGNVWRFTTVRDIPISDPNLVGWWKLDNEGTGTIIDYSGYGHHGTIHGAPLWVPGYDREALEFDGYADWVSIDGYKGILGSHAFSITAWIRAHTNGSILGWGHTAGRQGVDFRLNGQRLRVEHGGGNVQGDTSLNDNEWHHVALTVIEGGAIQPPDTSVWVDGKDDTRASTDADPYELSENFDVAIAQRFRLDNSRFFPGSLDDIRLYDKALTRDEIVEIMLRPEPKRAWMPYPANGAAPDIEKAAPLTWLPGNMAAQHDVYFGTDAFAVESADTTTADIYRGQQNTTSYTPPEALEVEQTYYWRIDQVNTDGTITRGSLWSFTVATYLVVDDFEGYDDLCNRIFFAWQCGFGHTGDVGCGVAPYNGNGTGSAIGNATAPFAEQSTVNSGLQSMPMSYNNVMPPFYSEGVLPFAVAQDFTRRGVKALTLYFQGDPANDANNASLYVAVEDSAGQSAVVKHDDPAALHSSSWQEWNIDMKQFTGVNLQAVNKLIIGVGDRLAPQQGGTGKLFIDDIRLHPPRCVPSLLKPDYDFSSNCVVDYPDLQVLLADWLVMESDIWDATGGPDGSSCLVFGDYVAIEELFYNSTGLTAVSVSCWIRTDDPADQYIISYDRNEYYRLEINGSGAGDGQVGWDLMTDAGQLDSGSVTRVDDDQWHHVVGVFDNGTATIYIDGTAEPSSVLGTTYGSGNMRYGFVGANSEAGAFDSPTPGGNPIQRIDDLRVYHYALSAADVAGLHAGTAQPAVGPILWYKFDETSGQLAVDSSGNGYDGHLRGFTFFDVNLYQDTVINFRDFDVLADTWLDELLWPQP